MASKKWQTKLSAISVALMGLGIVVSGITYDASIDPPWILDVDRIQEGLLYLGGALGLNGIGRKLDRIN